MVRAAGEEARADPLAREEQDAPVDAMNDPSRAEDVPELRRRHGRDVLWFNPDRTSLPKVVARNAADDSARPIPEARQDLLVGRRGRDIVVGLPKCYH